MQHVHEEGTRGGFIVSVGRDHYHAEIVFEGAELRMYFLGEDQAQIVDIPDQELEVFARPFGDARARKMVLSPRPQVGDREGMASLYVGTLPDDLPAKHMLVVVPTLRFEDTRYRFEFTTPEPLMPIKIADEAEQDLYLTPGGLYTDEDIAANGSQTASQKFVGFHASHDTNPPDGAKICPITNTLANPECTWIIGGEEYQFCCPPCVDEFLKLAKSDASAVKPADAYVKESK